MFELQAEHQTDEKGLSRLEPHRALLGRVLRDKNYRPGSGTVPRHSAEIGSCPVM
jgi:hypothetical protein